MTQLIYQWIDFVWQWIDFVWIPIGLIVVNKKQRIMTVIFILTCLLTLRTQVELMESINFNTGILPLMKYSLLGRGMVVYSIVIALFLILARYSPSTRGYIFFACVLTIYIFAFTLSMLLMIL